jgi:hypothetical protein
VEVFSVVGIRTDFVEVKADSRDVARSNLSGMEMGTVFEERFSDSGLNFERADDFRRNTRIAARC